MTTPIQVDFPSFEEIQLHLAAGRYYGIQSACGKKTKWPDFYKANAEAYRLYKKNPLKAMEAYPCYFCSPDKDNGKYTWHVGRAMSNTEWSLFYDSADKLLEMEDNNVDGVMPRTHPESVCEGEFCCIHNPSNHHMRTWRRNWRSDRRIMERICIHGIGHPDPDDAAYHTAKGNDISVHGCDGCCV